MTSRVDSNQVSAPSLNSARVREILLDIEGTTTPIAFVHEVLFPFARSRVRDYLVAHLGAAETDADIARLREEHAADVTHEFNPPMLINGLTRDCIESIVAYVHWLIDRDRKSTGLKSLQGKIWRAGYADGTLKAPVFTDVPPALARWRGAGMKIGIFSSGSLLAQQLLFAHTEAGDLTHLIDNYFDTTTGKKTATDSYRYIASALRRSESEVLFISDLVAELDAASAAGMQTLLCVRPGNLPQIAGRHQVIRSFAEILDLPEASSDLS
jgi:enolase-phosphatase E1